MTAQETAWQAAESAAAMLAPDADVLGSEDAAGLGASTFAVMQRAATIPGATAAAGLRFWTTMAMAGPVAAARWMGMDAPPPVPVPEGDKRFADRTWTDNPAFFALRQAQLATSRLVSDLLEAGSGNATDDAKAALILLASSTRRDRRPGTRRGTTAVSTRKAGRPPTASTGARGGRTGPRGPTPARATTSSRRTWGASGTRPSRTLQARMCSGNAGGPDDTDRSEVRQWQT